MPSQGGLEERLGAGGRARGSGAGRHALRGDAKRHRLRPGCDGDGDEVRGMSIFQLFASDSDFDTPVQPLPLLACVTGCEVFHPVADNRNP